MKKLLTLTAFVFALSAVERQSNAHPHVFITNWATLVLEKGEIVAIRHRWAFDGFFAALIKTEFDLDGNGVLDAAEIKTIHEQAFSNLREFNYFTWTLIKGEPARFLPEHVSNFKAVLEPKTVVYEFDLKLPKPVPPPLFALSVRDDTFYVDVAPAGDKPIRFEGKGAESCIPNIAEDPGNPIYGGFIYPIRMDLICKTS